MVSLRHALAHLGLVRKPVTLDDGDLLDMLGKGAGSTKAGEAAADDDGVTVLGHASIVADVAATGQVGKGVGILICPGPRR
ncbi:hypothetical protein Pa4123_76740 [Phytohabitans aurantiacus]|uniref:Uncharacterized protein n=1 Tax=Phytohabitans aurantiacus TaxID=3016789 RepID=A0ABQ5R765_9ACTN|nr:hypothetical protein Pa4123_76740 [Phytohabitans aurantiacus]